MILINTYEPTLYIHIYIYIYSPSALSPPYIGCYQWQRGHNKTNSSIFLFLTPHGSSQPGGIKNMKNISWYDVVTGPPGEERPDWAKLVFVFGDQLTTTKKDRAELVFVFWDRLTKTKKDRAGRSWSLYLETGQQRPRKIGPSWSLYFETG